MRKLTKRGVLYGSAAIGCLTLVIFTAFIKSVTSADQNRHVAIEYLRKISELDHELRESVLESRSFISFNYDRLVRVTDELGKICPLAQTLEDPFLFVHNAQIERELTEYCVLNKKILSAVEAFKSVNSLLGNSIKYFPKLTETINDPKTRSAAQEIYSETLLFCVQPSTTHSAQLLKSLENLPRILKLGNEDRKTIRALQKHAALIVKTAEERQRLEAVIYSPELREAITRFADNYVVATDVLETRSQNVKIGISACSVALLLALLILMYRLQTTADSLSELNESLEHKVTLRTSELSEALSDLEMQQQILAHATKMSALGEMAGGIAHEINTPLAAISLKAESLLFTEENSEPTVVGLGEIIQVVEKLSKIVTGLRRFSRDGQNEPLSLHLVSELVDETLDLCSQKFKSHGVDIRLTLDPALSINCVPEQISQVLLNLLNNSYDAVVALPERWIEIAAGGDETGCYIRVTDSGSGISPEIAQKIMQPFFTTKGVGKGTGIGLSISRGIVQKHGGTFNYDSEAKNTSFVIRLPKAAYLASA